MDHRQEALVATATSDDATSGKLQKSRVSTPCNLTKGSSLGLVALKGFKEQTTPVCGVVVVANADPAVAAMTLTAIAHGIVCDSTIADAPVLPVSGTVILHPHGTREAESMKAYASADLATQKLQFVALNNCRRLNPFAPEGTHIVTGQLKPGACVLLRVEYECLSRDEAIASLTTLHAEAMKVGALVVILLLHTKKQDATWLREYCGGYIEAVTCQPGPGAHVAVALINTSLADWHPLGIGRVMIEASLGVDGTWTYASEPYVSERAAMRLAWYLRAKGCTIADIAQVIGIHKSNVSRGFENLLIQPNNAVGMKPRKGSRARWATVYDLDEVWPLKAPDAGVADKATKTPDSPKTGDSGHAVKASPMANGTGSVPSNSPS